MGVEKMWGNINGMGGAAVPPPSTTRSNRIETQQQQPREQPPCDVVDSISNNNNDTAVASSIEEKDATTNANIRQEEQEEEEEEEEEEVTNDSKAKVEDTTNASNEEEEEEVITVGGGGSGVVTTAAAVAIDYSNVDDARDNNKKTRQLDSLHSYIVTNYAREEEEEEEEEDPDDDKEHGKGKKERAPPPGTTLAAAYYYVDPPPPLPLHRHSHHRVGGVLGSSTITSLGPGAHPVAGPHHIVDDGPEQPQQEPPEVVPPPPCIEGATLVVEDDDGDYSTTANCTVSGALTFCDYSQQELPVFCQLQQQQQYHDSPPSGPSNIKKKGWLYVVIATSLMMMFAAAITVGILLTITGTNSSTNSSSTNSSSSSTISSVPYAMHTNNPPFSFELLRSQTVQAIQSDDDTTTNNGAFARANLWMLQDPYRSEYTPTRQRQRFVLVWFYYVTGGSNWTRNDHWLSYNVSECDWYNDRHKSNWASSFGSSSDSSIPTCAASTKELQVLSLPNNNLEGNMPYFYETLPSLRILDIGYNNVGGVVPALGQLEINVISHNRFEGLGVQIGTHQQQQQQPKQDMTMMMNLRVNVYDGNRFDSYWTGAIFPLWRELQILNGTDNRNLRGFVAPTIQHCTSLTYFGIGGTNIGGALPSQFGLLTNLQEVYLAGSHKLRGTIPSQFGLLSKLTHLDITGTSLTGRVPETLCHRIHRKDDDPLTLVANCSALECCGE